ncbi:hypothetical protein EVAR_68512_1 [Eumeta japonica]|uniref:Uncharacterized protein n=1 Tax=Eumeta variegata TaxID=151549 RepID=A0A4C1ZHL9_EUMVA|nr:hypothetical protein EVAR_68512_1 [Eumeta japonica]
MKGLMDVSEAKETYKDPHHVEVVPARISLTYCCCCFVISAGKHVRSRHTTNEEMPKGTYLKIFAQREKVSRYEKPYHLTAFSGERTPGRRTRRSC